MDTDVGMDKALSSSQDRSAAYFKYIIHSPYIHVYIYIYIYTCICQEHGNIMLVFIEAPTVEYQWGIWSQQICAIYSLTIP